jgi:hypothetical protein
MPRSRLSIVPADVENRILLLRGERVMLDADLAALYGVETGRSRRRKRNSERFPDDLMFQLTAAVDADTRLTRSPSMASPCSQRSFRARERCKFTAACWRVGAGALL